MSSTSSLDQKHTRRTALGWLGGTVGALAMAGCGGSASSSDDSTTSTSTGTTTGSSTSSGSCAVTLEGEVGPYFTDDSASGYNRSNILSNIDGSDTQDGVALTLSIYVVDTENDCAPYEGAQIDIWHCNAEGIYSNESVESTLGQSWLRGYQLTDANGLVTFKTILPGWYQGRTTHIHLRVRSTYNEASSTSDGSNTTQLFFAQSLIDTLDTSVSPYSAEGKNTTTNASDRVYASQTQGESELTLTGSTSAGYTASYTLGLPITS